MGARRDHEEHEDMTMKSTKMTGGTDGGRVRLTFVAGLTFSNDGISRVNQEHEMSVRIEMIFAGDHNGYLDFFHRRFMADPYLAAVHRKGIFH